MIAWGVVVLVFSIPLNTPNTLPALCQSKPQIDSSMALQVATGCTSPECTQFTVRDHPQNETAQPFQKVNWTAVARPTVTCDTCAYSLEILQLACKQNPRMSMDEMIAECVKMNVPAADCEYVYRGISTLYCPLDPCSQLATAMKISPHAPCHSTPLSCSTNVPPTTSTTPEVPEKEFYSKPEFSPPRALPPYSCERYLTKMQQQCQDPLLAQWKFCDDLEGFPKKGCEFLAHWLSSRAIDGDICGDLFEINANSSRTPLDVLNRCQTFGFPEHSALPFDEWLQYQAPPVVPSTQTDQSGNVASSENSTVSEVTVTVPDIPEAKKPCIRVPEPTPLPRGIVAVFPRPIGYRTIVENKPLITFSCDAASSWVSILPKTGCLFKDWNVRSAGFGDAERSYPCSCRCSGHVDVCGTGPGSTVAWSDVRSAEDCAKMMCSKQRFDMCTFEDTVVATDGQWNGETVHFTSIALQETCQGASGTAKDFCGIVATIRTSETVPRTLGWALKSSSGAVIASSGHDIARIGIPTDLGVQGIWVPCGTYTVELTDSSWTGFGWNNVTLNIRDDKGYVLKRLGKTSGDGRYYSEPFYLDASSIETSKVGLCSNCEGEPLPCWIPMQAPVKQSCVPFISGTTDCPVGAVRC